MDGSERAQTAGRRAVPGKRRAGNRRRSHVTVASAELGTDAVDMFVAERAAGLHSSVAVVVVVQNKVVLPWAKEVGSIETHPFFIAYWHY